MRPLRRSLQMTVCWSSIPRHGLHVNGAQVIRWQTSERWLGHIWSISETPGPLIPASLVRETPKRRMNQRSDALICLEGQSGLATGSAATEEVGSTIKSHVERPRICA
eukprot:7073068-Karenia_brevis.AAC.1